MTIGEWRDELSLLGNLTTANQRIGEYVLRALDADAGRATPAPPELERDLGADLVTLGTRLCERARNRRAIPGDPPPSRATPGHPGPPQDRA